MQKSDFLDRFIFSHTNNIHPDGRPLYAYKCREEEYDQIKSMANALFQLFHSKNNRWSPRQEALLCIFASETWRRYHAGGAWKWEVVFNEINLDVPDHNWLSRSIETGLQWCQRPLLHNLQEHREFLITIACEGGLPLRLLQRENAHLKRYFRQLLISYHSESTSPSFNGVALARGLACHLPRSLHHDIVFTLSAELIHRIIALQDLVPDAIDPIAALEKQDKNWRHELPLPIEDDTIELLLKNLVTEARTLAITARQKIKWRTFFLQNNGEWIIKQRIEVPNTILGPTLYKWTGKQQYPPRFRLMLHSLEGVAPVALITRLRGEGMDTLYRCEILPRNGIKLTGQAALASARLSIVAGAADYPLHGQGNIELGPLPWVFSADKDQAEFLGEGSVRCRNENVLVVSPCDGKFEGTNGSFRLIAEAPAFNRNVYFITGNVEWQHPEFDICRFQCASSESNQEVLSLEGRLLAGVPDDTPPFLGIPGLLATNNDGGHRRINDGILEWRRIGGIEAEWQRDGQDCAGEVWIRYTDSTGCQRLRRKVRVMPSVASVEIVRIGSNIDEAGVVRLSGVPNIQTCCTTLPGCIFSVRPIADGVEIDCYSQPGLSVTQFQVSLTWKDGRQLTLVLPFPRQGAAFMKGGQTISSGEKIALSRVAAIHAVVQAPVGSRWFRLSVNVKTCDNLGSDLALNESIHLDSSGRGNFDLHQIQDKISSLLSLTDDKDDIVELTIFDREDQPLAQMEVGLFDLQLEPDYANNKVSLPRSILIRSDLDWEKRVTVRMIRLWAPEVETIVLDRSEEMAVWTIPDELEPGPWLVLGEDGDWPRFRPVLWNIDGELASHRSTMIEAIQESDRLTRYARLNDLIEQLASQANHPDWLRFWGYLRLTRRYPARTFDLFEHLACSSEALVMALTKSVDEDFDAIWSLAHHLPFSWHLLPVQSWKKSCQLHFESLKEKLVNIDPTGEIAWTAFQDFRARVTNRQPFFRQICDWLAPLIFPDRPLENSELELARHAPQIFTGFIASEEQKLQERHDPDERYPQSEHIKEYRHRTDFPDLYRYKHRTKPYRSVLSAPFVAAHIALNGSQYNESLLFDLHRLRYFDKDWFDWAFAFSLCLGLAKNTNF